jgi:hypothetical protein
MKTSLTVLIYVLALAAGAAQAAEQLKTVAQLDLHCEGQLKLIQVEPAVIETHLKQTRAPQPILFSTTSAVVHLKFSEVSPGCEQAQKIFGLSFKVVNGQNVTATLKMYGKLSQEAMQFSAEKISEFKFVQTFYSKLPDGSLPLFPFYHSESVELVTVYPSYTLKFEQLTESMYFGNSIFNYESVYGVKNPKLMSIDEKFEQLKKILDHVKSMDLTQSALLSVLTNALSNYDPDHLSQADKFSANKKFIELVIPLLDEVTLKTLELSTASTGVRNIYDFLYQKVLNSYTTYNQVPLDLELLASTLTSVPLIMQVASASPKYISLKSVEVVLMHFKQTILADKVSPEKIQQLKSTALYLKNKFANATSASVFPLSDKSSQLIEEILFL